MKIGWVGIGKLGVPFDDVADVNIYCGRWPADAVARVGELPPGWIYGELGNPYKGGDREQNCRMFATEYNAKESARSLLWHDAVEWIHRTARAGQNVRLWCHCHPKNCHCGKLQHEAVLRLIFPDTPEVPYSWES